MPSNVWPKKMKTQKFQFLQLLEGDRSQSRLPFKIFSTLNQMIFGLKNEKISREIVKGDKAISVLNPLVYLVMIHAI